MTWLKDRLTVSARCMRLYSHFMQTMLDELIASGLKPVSVRRITGHPDALVDVFEDFDRRELGRVVWLFDLEDGLAGKLQMQYAVDGRFDRDVDAPGPEWQLVTLDRPITVTCGDCSGRGLLGDEDGGGACDACAGSGMITI